MKSFILVALCLVSALSFQMTDVAEVEWPFNNCGDGDFTVTKFTWSDTPVKGGTVTFSVVAITLFRLEPPKTALVSSKSI